MNRLHALIVYSFLILSSTISYSQTFQNVPLFIRANADNIGLDDGEEIFRIRNAWLNRIKNGTYDNIQIQIPSNEGSYTLLASKRQIVPDDGIKVTTASGQYFQEEGGKHYFGTIAGVPNSTVIISSIGEQLHILVQDINKKIRVVKNHPDISDRYLSLETSEFDNIINCGSSDEDKRLKKGSPSLNRSTGNCNVVCDSPCSGTTDLNVYYEFDFISFLDENSSINDCITFMTMTHAVINHIYSNIDQVANNQHNGHPNLSSDINMIFSGFHIWDSPDPYPIEIFARRTAFQTVRPTFDGDVAHLINKGTINAGGIASIDLDNTSASLCDNGNPPAGGFTPHSLSFLTATPVNFANTFSFGTALIAHEIGHTLGGRHPNECKWYDNNDFAIHRDMGTCEIFPTPACNHPTCTITTGYNPTIMSRCWFTNSPANTIDYANPFHREIALNILENLCNINLCYVPCNSDNDLDGFCTNDPNECDDTNPTIPGVVGQPCSDGNSQTVDDMFVVDSNTPDPDLSCICVGTLWSNPVGTDACNLIIGGPLDFEDDIVGAGQGTWYGGLQTGWTTSPGNTPDIGHGIVAGNCEQFIGFAGSWNSNTTPQRVGIKEGVAIELSTPIPCNVGQFHLSFDYGLINTNGNQPFTNDLINVQGTEALITMMPHDCPHPGVECLTTLGNPSLVTAHNNFNSVFSNNCSVNLDFATQPASTVINNANFDLNFIYLSFDVDANMPDGVHEVLLDNISINILPQSYGDPSSFTNACIIETIDHSIYCDIDLQRFNGSDWESVSFNNISTSEYVDSGFKMVSRVIDFEVLDCADYRIVQTCPPGGADESCDTRVIDVDLRECDNTLAVELITSPQQDTFCIGDQVILYDPDYAGFDAVWSSPLWSSDTMTTTAQITLADELSVDSVGTHLFSVTVTDDSGCTGIDTINLIYEDCTPMLSACGRSDVNFVIELNEGRHISDWLDIIPHTIEGNFNTFENLTLFIDRPANLNALIIDADIRFRNCTILVDDNTSIRVESTVDSESSEFLNCDDRWVGFNVRETGALNLRDNSSIIRTQSAIVALEGAMIDIQSSIIDNCLGRGIDVRSGHLMVYEGSRIENCEVGIYSQRDNNSLTVTDSEIIDCDTGIEVRSNPGIYTISHCAISSSEGTAIKSSAAFSGLTIDNCTIDTKVGISTERNSTSGIGVISNNSISTDGRSINLGRGSWEIKDNPLITSTGTEFNFSSVIQLNANSALVDNNVIVREGIGSGVVATGTVRGIEVVNNDVEAGGIFGFSFFPAIYTGGARNGGLVEDNVITTENAPGIYNLNSPGTDMICNDIIADHGFWTSRYTSGIWNDSNSDEAYMETNTLESPLDLYTESTIVNQFHTGNCFNGERIEANGFSDQDVAILGMIFDVDGSVEPCYFQSNRTPQAWMRPDIGNAIQCGGLPGSGIGTPTDDTTRVCRYLEFLEEQLQDSTRRDLTIMRLISLFRMYSDSTIMDDVTVPECLKIYLDTTSVCGIKMLLEMDSLVTTATLGSDTIRVQIQVQSTLTYLTMLQWRNASEEDKDSLRLVYIQELEKLRLLVQVKRNEEDRIWTEIDSIQIIECIDSISMIEMMAYKYMARNSLTEDDYYVIDSYSRRCASQYGRGIHLMRAIAATFSQEDYRQYDTECEDLGLEQRTLRSPRTDRNISVVPNPSHGQVSIIVQESESASQLLITDLMGTHYFSTDDVLDTQDIIINEIGVYILHVIYNDGTTANEKFIVLE